MNLHSVLRAYSLLRQLGDDESALLNILRTLNDNDREQLIATMSDKPQKKAGKKTATSNTETERVFKPCEVCGLTKRFDIHKDAELGGYHEFVEKKSTRASSIRQQIQSTTRANTPPDKCTGMISGNGGEMPCGGAEDDPIHDPTAGYAGYHEFQSSQLKTTAATGD